MRYKKGRVPSMLTREIERQKIKDLYVRAGKRVDKVGLISSRVKGG